MTNHTVLVVEDEEELREMIREVLEESGYDVVTAAEGGQALAAMGRIQRPCLVLLDLLMPGMNGWDFYEKLKERPELADVPVVVHTSSPDRAPAGVARVLRKPLRLERLLETVREFCAG
jgi:CheY-like chemotaxis protein